MTNKHIFEYLDYYIDHPTPPHYAVMITGPWGIGKSYHVKRYIEQLESRGTKVAYVSLYGAKSTDDIAISILAALTPIKNNKLAKLGTQLARAAWKRLPALDLTQAVTDFVPDSWVDLLILDDLERAKISPTEILGFVNTFIEHEGRRVLIVANENEVPEQEEYRRTREKVIGMTFEFSEQTREALDSFISAIASDETRKFLNSQINGILDIFSQSRMKNLRILHQSLKDWERVFETIGPNLRHKERGIVSAFQLFLALSLEVRAGRLTRADLADRVDQIVHGNMIERTNKNEKPPALCDAQKRYEHISLYDSILSDEVLIAILCDGKVEASSIEACLSHHPLFMEPDEEPNWRKVWHGFLRDAEEFETAFNGLEQEFAQRAFDDTGIFLHVVGLRLWGAEIGQISRTQDEVKAECKAYIDELRRAGRIKRYRPDVFHDAAYGLRFHNAETSAFREIVDYYVKQAEAAYRETWPSLGRELLEDMSNDCQKFRRRISWVPGEPTPDCAGDAILSQISASDFVNKLLSLTPSAQRVVMEGLSEHYAGDRLKNNLKPEATWLIDIEAELEKRLPQLPPIRKFSLRSDFTRLLSTALKTARELTSCPTCGRPGVN